MKKYEQALIDYGFPSFVIEELLKGKKTKVNYGLLHLNRNTGVLTTKRNDGTIKEENIKES